MLKISLTITALFFVLSVFAQSGSKVFFKWKLQPKEVIEYKTVMEEVDTTSDKSFGVNFGAMNKLLGDSTKDDSSEMKKLFSELDKINSDNDFITRLTQVKDIVDVEMSFKPKPETNSTGKDTAANSVKNMLKMMQKMNGDIVLRGAVNTNGTIQSFYLKNDQRNLIALFFELPGKPVAIGDSWALDVHLISMDQNFKCDSSFRKNIVTLIDIKKVGTETVATLKYDIEEYVSGAFKNPFAGGNIKSTMLMSYKGLAEFLIDKGRWKTYNGIMVVNSTGVMTSNSTKKIRLSDK